MTLLHFRAGDSQFWMRRDSVEVVRGHSSQNDMADLMEYRNYVRFCFKLGKTARYDPETKQMSAQRKTPGSPKICPRIA